MLPPALRKPGLAVAASLALVAAIGCGRREEPPTREVIRPVKLETFGGQTGKSRYAYPGRVFPNQTVELAFEVTGQLKELPIKKGEEVEAGQLLGRLDQRDFRNDLAAAKAVRDEAVATAARYRKAAKSGAVSRREVDEADARERAAEAEYRIRKKALDDTELRAKFDGVVADRYVDNFQNVTAKEPIVSLQEVSTLEVRIDVPERDIGGERIRQEIERNPGTLTATFEAVPGRVFELEVKEFVTDADPTSQTFPVTLSLPNPEDVGILPGMTATVTWVPPKVKADARIDPTLPAIAVVGQEGREPWVWLVDRSSMTVSRHPVQVGALVKRDRIEIRGGLEPGQVVAVAGVNHLSEGMKIRAYGE